MRAAALLAGVVAGMLALGAPPVAADGLRSLESFLRNAQSGRANFSQVVTPPPREGSPARPKSSTGSFEFQRPDRFRFQYARPYEQLLVADGNTLWLFDPDLNQVTARPQAQALANAPVALLSGSSDLSALRRDFILQAAPEVDGQSWVDATPRARDGALRRLRIGFRDGTLSTLEIEDALGQKTVLRFETFQLNVPIPPERWRFVPPAGADVVRP